MKMLKKIVVMILAILGITTVAVGVYAYSVINTTESTLSSTFDDLGIKTDDSKDAVKATDPFTILLMGIDTGDNTRNDTWSGNSDTMMVATVNPNTKTTTIVSLERDMLTNILDENGNVVEEAKLNAAYAYGGAKAALLTIQQQIGLSIDKYALINMQGLEALVDAVGGIDVNNTLGITISIEETEPAYTATIDPGEQHINGAQALVYARMRHQDPEGDIGRQTRQREVITQLVKKLLSLENISKYQKILEAISGNIKTNLAINTTTLRQLLGYKDAFETVDTVKLQGVSQTLSDGGSYQVMPASNLLSVQNYMKRSLEQSPLTKLSNKIITFESLYGYSPLNLMTVPSVTSLVSGQTAPSVKYIEDSGKTVKDLAQVSQEDSASQTTNAYAENQTDTAGATQAYGDETYGYTGDYGTGTSSYNTYDGTGTTTDYGQ